MAFEKAQRVQLLPPYLFDKIDRLRSELVASGADVINLGVGDPDLPTPPHIVEALSRAALDGANHQYPSYAGMYAFRESVARWYKTRFGLELDPKGEVLALIGSKEGLAHLPLAFVNPGDVTLCPSPAYPVYKIGTILAGGEPYEMPLLRENRFLPDLDAIPPDVARRAKIIYINYPNNPTGATAGENFYLRVIEFAREYGLIVCADAAYTEMAFDGYRPMSFLEVPGAREVGIELHSLSKTYNMTGWRLGMAVGNADVIAGLGHVKSQIDSGQFNAVQWAGVAALDGDQACVAEMRRVYAGRRDVLVSGLRGIGLDPEVPKATFYVWCPVPAGYDSARFASLLLKEAHVVATPGVGFGEPGEGYFRIALTVTRERLEEAVHRIGKLQI